MGWFNSSREDAANIGRYQKVAKTGLTMMEDSVYYLGKDGHVWATINGDEVKVADAGVTPEIEYLYFISEGDVCRVHQSKFNFTNYSYREIDSMHKSNSD